MVEETEVKTMWSETLLESLYVAMEKQKGNKIVIEIIRDLKAKGYENEYLVDKVGKKVGPTSAARLKNLLSGGAPIKAANPQKSAQGKSALHKNKPGLITKIMGLFK